MAATSIHIAPCKGGSESHNLRKKELDYVRKDLTHLNESSVKLPIKECLADIKKRYEVTTGQKMQSKATPIREGVVVIESGTTMAQLQNFADELEKRFGIKTIQIHTHKDEGHKDSKDWKPNLHAHMVFNWTDDKGKSLKLNKQDLSDMQTILAESIGMERGKSSDVKHLNAVQFKIEKEQERLDSLQPKPLGAVLSYLTAHKTEQATENKQLVAENKQLKGDLEALKRTSAKEIDKSLSEIEKLKNGLKDAEKDREKSLTEVAIKFSSWYPDLASNIRIDRECNEIKMPQDKIDTLIRDKELNYTGELFSPGHARTMQVENIDFAIKDKKLEANGTTISKMFDWVVNLFTQREAKRLEDIRLKEEKANAKLTPIERELKQKILDSGGTLKDWEALAKSQGYGEREVQEPNRTHTPKPTQKGIDFEV